VHTHLGIIYNSYPFVPTFLIEGLSKLFELLYHSQK